jgi:hypothetical protein
MTTKKSAAPKRKSPAPKPAAKTPRKSKEKPIDPPALLGPAPSTVPKVEVEAARRIAIQWHHHLSHLAPSQAEKFQKLLEKSQKGLEIAADFARAQARLEDQKVRDSVLPRFEIPACPKLVVTERNGIDYEGTTRKARAGAVRMADIGWTFAAWMGPGYAAALATAPYKEIDAVLVERYRAGGSLTKRLKLTSQELLTSPQLKPWKQLLKLTFKCLLAEQYALCVPALLNVIEEYVSACLVYTLKLSPSSIRPHVDLENGLAWSSTVVFVNHMFANSHFYRPVPSSKNRPSLPQIRPEVRWKQPDALKLVNALATLHMLFKPES